MARIAPPANGVQLTRRSLHRQLHRPHSPPSELPPQLASARATRDSVAGYGSDRAYANFTGDAGVERVRACYPPDTYRRLAAVKDRGDPANLFRFNLNIKPGD